MPLLAFFLLDVCYYENDAETGKACNMQQKIGTRTLERI